MSLDKTQKIVFDITLAWNEYEDHMGENAALEVACEEHGKTSSWYYDNVDEETMNEVRKHYEKNK